MNEIYEFTIPVFIKLLGGLKNVLAKAEIFAEEKGISEEEFLKTALAPDMFPLVKQVQTASDHAKGAAARLSGSEVPSFPDEEKTFAELQARLDKTIAFMNSVSKESFANAATQKVSISYWKGKSMSGFDYARQYAIPNFFFHVTTAYGIVRHRGVAIGKSDYINGLSFEEMESSEE